MPITLDKIVPWGRSFKEYVRMFALTDADLDKRILGCGDGPASFNVEMRTQGKSVVSVDPLYQFSKEEIAKRVQEAYRTILDQLVADQSSFVWTMITSPSHLGRIRMAAMRGFLRDFERGKAEDRYLSYELPSLPFADGAFDLALCSHLLFTYSEHLSASFHAEAVLEMCRVASEVRIFPIVEINGQPSRHIPDLCGVLSRLDLQWSVQQVEYRFQRGANEMLTIRRLNK
jgi:hypothetical protein